MGSMGDGYKGPGVVVRRFFCIHDISCLGLGLLPMLPKIVMNGVGFFRRFFGQREIESDPWWASCDPDRQGDRSLEHSSGCLEAL